MEFILEFLASFVIKVIEQTGYTGITALMALESANIPIPSEIIMPFSGYLVFEEKFNFYLVILSGTVGNLIGSLVSYYLGFFGGRSFLAKYGKFFFVTHHDLELADRLFQKYGSFIIFASRILPIVRTFISFPAGIAKMNIIVFTVNTFFGSLIWSIILTYTGVIAGENWKILELYFRKFDWLIAGILLVLGIWWIWRHMRDMQSSTLI